MKSPIVCLVLLSMYAAQGLAYRGNWITNLHDGINQQVNANIMSMNRQLQYDIDQHVSQINDEVQRAVEESIAANQGRNSGGNVQSIIMNSNAGGSQSTISGYGIDGQFYRRTSQEATLGNTLQRIDSIYYPLFNITKEFRYILHLTNPNVRPVLTETSEVQEQYDQFQHRN